MIFIYVTTSNEAEAKMISRHLLEKRLIACANIFPIQSQYWWDGKIEEGKEAVAILKTEEGKYEQVRKEIEGIHSYKVPCITKINVKTNKSYERWMTEQIGGRIPDKEKNSR